MCIPVITCPALSFCCLALVCPALCFCCLYFLCRCRSCVLFLSLFSIPPGTMTVKLYMSSISSSLEVRCFVSSDATGPLESFNAASISVFLRPPCAASSRALPPLFSPSFSLPLLMYLPYLSSIFACVCRLPYKSASVLVILTSPTLFSLF